MIWPKDLKRRFKDWLFNRYLAEASSRAMAMAQKDLLDTMEEDLAKRADKLADEKLAKLLSVVDPNHVISWDKRKGMVFIGGERATEGQLGNLKAEAEYLSASSLWKLLYESPKQLAHIAMFKEGDSIDFLKKGRTMLFTLQTQQEIIDLLRSYNKN